MMTATPVESIPPIARAEVEGLARTEYQRMADQLRSLSPDDWTKPTDCPLWDVRAVAGHSTGMLSTFTGFRKLMREMSTATKSAKRWGGPMIDALTAKQVADHAALSTSDLIAKIDETGPLAARWRASRPALFRRMPMKEEVGGEQETWRMGYLLDVILTRDPWMHRVDVASATGGAMTLTPEHDGRIVADVVAEWARRHGQPFHLTLTGHAGAEYTAGDRGVEITIDAVEFCRTLSGRIPGSARARSSWRCSTSGSRATPSSVTGSVKPSSMRCSRRWRSGPRKGGSSPSGPCTSSLWSRTAASSLGRDAEVHTKARPPRRRRPPRCGSSVDPGALAAETWLHFGEHRAVAEPGHADPQVVDQVVVLGQEHGVAESSGLDSGVVVALGALVRMVGRARGRWCGRGAGGDSSGTRGR